MSREVACLGEGFQYLGALVVKVVSFFLVVGKMEDHLNRSTKMKTKMVETKVCSNKDVTFCP